MGRGREEGGREGERIGMEGGRREVGRREGKEIERRDRVRER